MRARKSEQEKKQNEQCRREAMYDFIKTIRRFCPELFRLFGNDTTKDGRVQAYVLFTMRYMLTILFFKYACSIISMHALSLINYDGAVATMMRLSGQMNMPYLPTPKAINDFLCKLTPSYMEGLRDHIIFSLIRSKNFYQYRLHDRWVIIVDGTQIYGGKRMINPFCLFRIHNKGTADETTSYHIQVLEAKLHLLGTNLAFSIMTEFIENTPEGEYGSKPMSDEKYKQDCELKAFRRLAEKLKKRYPNLPICITADALYNCASVMAICEEYNWKYIFRFKDGTIPFISQEVAALSAYLKTVEVNPVLPFCGLAYLNDINYEGHMVAYVRATDKEVPVVHVDKRGRKKVKKGKTEAVTFQYITNFRLTNTFAIQVVTAGRARWTIENFGFNRQKHWISDITHISSWNQTAIKNHYLMIQIVDIFRMLFEFYTYERKNIKRTYENIASDLRFRFTLKSLFIDDDPANLEIMNKLKLN